MNKYSSIDTDESDQQSYRDGKKSQINYYAPHLLFVRNFNLGFFG